MRLIYHKTTGPRHNKTHEFQIVIDGKEYYIIQTCVGLTIINPDGDRLYLDTSPWA